MQYIVTWTMPFEADSPLDAAKQAWATLDDATTNKRGATCLVVRDPSYGYSPLTSEDIARGAESMFDMEHDLESDDEDDDRLPCGCRDYHMADCPRLTDRFGSDDPPEPDDDFDPRRDAPDPFQESFATEAEARAFAATLDSDPEDVAEWRGVWYVDHYDKKAHDACKVE